MSYGHPINGRLPEWAFWGPGRRWAVERPAHPQGVVAVRAFRSEKERDAWVAANPAVRSAAGVRHPAVKAYRRRVTGHTNI